MEDREFSLEEEYLRRFPGLCTQCGSRVCICPHIPEATVGRLSKELDIRPTDNSLFISELLDFEREGREAAVDVLERTGGYPALTSQLPFDRGDANHALILLCLRLADAVQRENPPLAERLRSEAVKISGAVTPPGTRKDKPFDAGPLLKEIIGVWRSLDQDLKSEITSTGGQLVGEIAEMMGRIRVLFVQCSPSDQDPLRVASELRAANEAVQFGTKGKLISIDTLPAATVDDLRRALLSKPYEIVHFSGHADEHSLYFENAEGQTTEIPLAAIGDLIKRYGSVKCVVLNACNTAKAMPSAISPIMIGMADSIADDAAIEFTRGFYDALASGKTIEFSVEEGITAVKLKQFDGSGIVLLRQ